MTPIGQPRGVIWPILPLRVRLRLIITGWVDGAAIAMVYAGRPAMAERLWRACRMW